MDKIELFDYFCKKCQDGTYHLVSKISRLKGIKLKCMLCGTESRYVNFKDLTKGGEKNEKRRNHIKQIEGRKS